ncbi:AraC-like ligand-binding domain-containing protein [Streptomyces sp. NPDC001966]
MNVTPMMVAMSEERVSAEGQGAGAGALVSLSSGELPQGDRFDWFAELVRENVAAFSLGSAHAHGFEAQVTGVDLGSAQLTHLVFEPLHAARTPRHIRRGDPETYQLALIGGSPMVTHQHDNEAEIPTGSLVFFDTSHPLNTLVPDERGQGRVTLLRIPRSALPLPAGRVDRVLARRLVPDGVTGQVLCQYLTTVRDRAADLGTDERHRLGTIAVDLAAAFLTGDRHRGRPARAGAAGRDAAGAGGAGRSGSRARGRGSPAGGGAGAPRGTAGGPRVPADPGGAPERVDDSHDERRDGQRYEDAREPDLARADHRQQAEHDRRAAGPGGRARRGGCSPRLRGGATGRPGERRGEGQSGTGAERGRGGADAAGADRPVGCVGDVAAGAPHGERNQVPQRPGGVRVPGAGRLGVQRLEGAVRHICLPGHGNRSAGFRRNDPARDKPREHEGEAFPQPNAG